MATKSLGLQDFFSTTITADITDSETVIPLASVPTASEGYLVLESDNASKREVIYYTSKGASSVTCPSAAAGRGVGGTTAQAHSSGATVKMNMTAEYWNALQNMTSTSDAVVLARHLDTTAGEIGGAWKTYTPVGSFTGGQTFTIGSGTLTGKYTQIGKTVHFEIFYKQAADTNWNSGAGLEFTLPVTGKAIPTLTYAALNGGGWFYDASGAVSWGPIRFDNASTPAKVHLGTMGTASTYLGTAADINASVPWTWATNDEIVITGTYEAA